MFVECDEVPDVIKKGNFLSTLSSTSFAKRALIHKYYFVSWCFMSYKLLWVIIVRGFSLNKNTFTSCPKYFSRHTMNTTQNISGNVPWCRLLLRSTSQEWTGRFSCHQTLSQLTYYRYWSYLAEHRPHNVQLSANTYRKSYLNLCQNIRWAHIFCTINYENFLSYIPVNTAVILWYLCRSKTAFTLASVILLYQPT